MRTSQPTILSEAVRRCSSLVLFSLTLIAALSFSASSHGQSNQPDLVKLCSITDFSDAANGHGLFLANIAGIPDNKYEFFPGAPGTLELFSDGTARVKGRVRNKTDQSLVWDIDFHYTGGADWTTWSAGGGNYKDEASLAGSNYLDWDYFIFDASESNTLTGVDGLAGSALTVTHMPANFEFGLQIGAAANSKNANDGASVWFFIDGTVLGNTVSGHGDLNLNTACSEILTNCPLEQYAAGDHILWLPGVASGSDWVPAPFGVYFAELAGGEARLYGEIQNQNDPSLVLCVDFWFSDKSDFAIWSGLGRNVKGNPSNINGNEVNWDFYIFNPNRVSSLSGCSPSTLGSYITVEHMPADYNFGLQVGLGANDKNAQFGLSTWFFTEGVFQGNPVSSQGDVNSINLCPPPPNIICFENPPIITCPADTTIDCSSETGVELLGEATADKPTTECPLDVAIFFEDEISVNGCETVITRTWTVIDEYDNTVSCDQVITIIDTTAPELEMPADLDGDITCADISVADATGFANGTLTPEEEEAFLDAASALFVSNGLIPTGTNDDCNGSDWEEISIEVTLGDDCDIATLICTFVAVDDCGNTSEPVSTTLNLIDNTAPVITCPSDATVDCTADNSPAATGTATATDDCGDATVTYADSGLSGDGCVNTFTRTWTATDACGNTSTCDQVITITDTTAPELEMPADLDGDITCSDISLQDAQGYANNALSTADSLAFLASARQLFMDNGLIPLGTTDDCNGSNWEEIAIEVSVSEDCAALATLSCIFIAVDDCGNASAPTATILNIIDNTAPVITCPSDVIVSCDDDTSPIALGMATATDDCNDVIDISFEDSAVSGTCPEVFTRTWTASDACGNLSTCDQLITIADNEAPVKDPNCEEPPMTFFTSGGADCPSDAVIDVAVGDEIDETGLFTIAGLDLGTMNMQLAPCFTDNCTDDLIYLVRSVDNGDALEECSKTIVVEIEAVDDCGNVSVDALVCTFIIEDDEAPIKDPTCEEPPMTLLTSEGAVCPSDAVADLQAGDVIDENALFTVAGIDMGAMGAQLPACFSDNCADALTYIVRNVDNGGAEECSKTITIEIEAADDCGNVSVDALVCTFIIEDDEAPIKDPTCEEPPMTLLTSEGAVCPSDAVADLQAGDVIDENALFTVAGIDMGAMGAQLPACFSDNCADALTYIVRNVDNGGTEECSKTITIEIEAADDCGNVSTDVLVCTFIIEDDVAPVITCPSDVDVECTADNSPASTGTATATDDCGDATVTYADSGLSGDGCVNTFTRTWTATDACGNTSTCDQVITIIDTTAPDLEMPADLDGDITCADISVADATGFANGTLTPEEEEAFLDAASALFVSNGLIPTGTNDDCNGSDWEEISIEVTLGDDCDIATLICTFVAVDDCGNTSEPVSTTLNLIDNTAPVITCPSDATVDCTADNSPASTGTATATDDCGEATVTYADSGLSGDGCVNTFTRTWTATDACGNTSTCDQVITITDTTAPELEMPADLDGDITCSDISLQDAQGYANNALSTADSLAFLASARQLFMDNGLIPLGTTDDCNGSNWEEIAIEVSVSEDCAALATLSCIFIAVDDCGNASAPTATILNIIDNTAPVITCPSDVTVDCTADNSPAATGTATATDDCGEATVTYADSGLSGDGCVNTFTRTWTATDACGNTSTCDQIITITDTTAPELEMPADLDGDITCSDISLQDAQGYANNALSTADSLAFLASARQLFMDNGLIPLGTTDNCNGSNWEEIAIEVSVSEDCAALATLSCIFVAVDDCGNTSEPTATILNIIDNTAPVITCPQDAAISCSDDMSPAFTGSATATDDCGEAVTVTYADSGLSGDGCADTFTRTWTATDACGNASTCDQIITITDDEAPVAPAAPDNATASCDEELPVAPELIASDACQGDVIGVLSEETIAGDCANNFTIVRTWTFDDGCGNVSSVSSEVVVSDTEAPEFNLGCEIDFLLPTSAGFDCPSDAGFSFQEGDEFSINDGYTIAGFDAPSLAGCVSDNCTAADDLIIRIAAIIESGDDCEKSFTVDFEAIDACGNVGGGFSCDYIITDDVAPDLEMPADLDGDITCADISVADATGFANGTLTPEEEEAFLDAASALFVSNGLIPTGTNDDCNGSDWEEISIEVTLGDDCDIATLICTFVAVDDCGNTSEPVSTTLNLIDNTAPVITCPSDATVDCTADNSPASTGTATATDDCGEATVTYADSGLSGDGCVNTFTRTWTATDACGNTSTCDQVITITDTTAPELEMPADLDGDITCSDISLQDAQGYANNALSTADSLAFLASARQLFMDNGLIPLGTTDDCNGSNWEEIAIEVSVSEDCAALATLSCIFIAVDDCGNASAPTATILNIIDNTAPVITCPSDVTVDCTADNSPAATGTATATDDCGEATVTYADSGLSGDGCVNTFTRTWTATDACGNTSTCDQIITITDTTAPELEMPADLDGDITCSDISLQDAQGYANNALSTADSLAFLASARQLFMDNGLIPLGTTDNCNGSNWEEIAIEVSVSEDCAALATLSCIFVAVDDCGNTSEPTATILNIIDNTAPVITCPQDAAISCSDDMSPAFTGSATATDDCGEAVTVTYADSGLSGDGCADTFTRTWTATDACGNASTCDQIITITDDEAPVAPAAPDNATASCDEELPVAPELIASDACQGDVIGVLSEETIAGDCANNFTIVRTWTFDDGCGNVSSVSSEVVVSDTEAPVFNLACELDFVLPTSAGFDCPSDAGFSFQEGDEFSINDGYTIAGFDAPSLAGCVSDNCTAADDLIIRIAAIIESGDDCEKSFTVDFEAIDACGNVGGGFSCDYIITDDVAPDLEMPADLDGDITCADISVADATGFANGTLTPEEEEAFLDAASALFVSNGLIPTGTNDDCNGSNWEEIAIEVSVSEDCAALATLSCIFIAVDDCGNASAPTATILNIIDNTAPVITCPSDVTVDCTADNSPAATGTATATDDCGEATVTYADSGLSGDGCVNTFTRTWTATDACGNTSTCDQIITITDTTAPELEMPADLDGDITCSDISLQDAQGYANNALSTADSLAFLASARQLFMDNGLIPLGTTDNCNGSNWEEIAIEVSVSEDCAALATLSCIFVAVDDCGNTSEPTATILNIIDNTAPVITCPQDAAISCSDDMSPAFTGSATATDDCGEAVTVTYADSGLSGDGCADTFTRTWTATDACGNASTCDQIITITDDEAPVAPAAPDNATASCDEELPVAPELIASDACQGDVIGVLSEETIAGDCANNFTIVRTWTFDDGCGNVSSVSSEVVVSDTEAPEFNLGCEIDFLLPTSAGFDCPSDAGFSFQEGDEFSINDGYTIAGFDAPSLAGCVSDNCTAADDLIIRIAAIIESGDDCEKSFTVDFEAIDACGNVGGGFSCDYIITDDVAPDLEMPADLDGDITCADISVADATGFANGTLTPEEEEAFLDAASALFVSNGLIPTGTNDDCNGSDWEEISIEVTLGDDCDIATLICTFVAVDDCGNTSEPVSTTLNLIDNTAPVITCPSDATVDCTADNSPASTGMATATDDCGDATVTYADSGLSGDGCVNTFTRTWTATDACGNTSTCDQVITIIDTTAPELEMPADLDGDITCSDISLQDAQGYANNALSTADSLAFLASARQLFMDNGLIPLGTNDNCNGSNWEEIAIEVSVSEDCAALATLSCIFVAVDDCGNTSEPTATILNIIDNTAPVITCPQDAAISCSDDMSPAFTGSATATDDCGEAVTVTYADSGLSGDGCADTFTRTWTATDACGNASTCDQIITITDDEAPVAPAAPDNATASCDEELPVAPELIASDACQGDVIGVLSEETIAGDCANNFTIVRTWTFDDGCGNVSSVSSEVVVSDTEAPEFNLGCEIDFLLPTSAGFDCPSDAGFSFQEGDEFSINDGYTIAGFDAPSLAGCVSDNCTAADDLIIRIAAIIESGDDCEKSFTVDFEAIDACGNVGGGFSCDYIITDDVAPDLEMPADLDGDITCADISVADATGFANGTLTPEEEEAFLDAASALFVSNGLIPTGTNDDCNGSDWEEISIEVTLGDDCDIATLICTFVAVDDCGNTSEPVSTTLNLIDNTAPVITCPSDATVDCTADNSPASTGMATATDDCGDATVTYADSGLSGDGCVNTFTRTWTATDACGNTSTCDQIITIIDTTAPELEMPEESSMHITCMAVDYAMLLDYVDGSLSATQMSVYESFLAGIFMQNGLVPTAAIDDCNDASFTETGIEISTDVDCPSKATVRCVFVAVDACGNESEPIYTELVVVDNTTPHIFCPADIVVTCGSDTSPDVTGFATATDNCIGLVEVTYEDLYVSDICPSSFIRVWSAADECGNVATCEQLITTVEEGDCVTAPNGLEAQVVGSNSIHFSWNPVPNSVACRVFGRPSGGSSNLTLGTIMGTEPSELSFTSNQLQDGLLIEWRVICACELDPLMTSPYSPWSEFYFMGDSNKNNEAATNNESELKGDQLNGELYPNPTRTSVFINSVFEEGDILTVMDLSGKVVGQYNVPVASGLFEINLAELESGVYFVQHSGLNGRSQTFKVVKNN